MKETESNKKQVWNYGGGTQSVAIAVLILQGKLPKPDYVVIADTEREKQTTWDYLASHVRPAFLDIGISIHIPRKSDYSYGHDGVFNNKGTLLIPAFTSETEDGGKLPAFCSTYWKKDVVQNYMKREFGISRSEIISWIGFSLDEPKRYFRMMKGDDYQAGKIRFPLVHDVPTRRQECSDLVEAYGWPKPPRSSCWMCPNMGNDEWAAISKEELAMAIELEKEIQKRDPNAWFHKSMKPLSEVVFDDDGEKPDYCQQGLCFV